MKCLASNGGGSGGPDYWQVGTQPAVHGAPVLEIVGVLIFDPRINEAVSYFVKSTVPWMVTTFSLQDRLPKLPG
ncbi:hypothetical protein PG993_000719 [Apiospora rasikravindrae]|uniref:Uncharacterized protein n=1 Tax=Apiospora rasikravindrae TaxID=990691 RepID=A0ABR1U9W1_9PEZI